MSGCMATDKPLVSIVMAVYEPNMDWLREQLESLNVQTYQNLELHILDDCSTKVSFSEIQSCVRDCISAFPYTIDQNEKNLGSNQTFERLTLMAKGEYIAYCDQDDVWLPEKIETLIALLQKEKVSLVCSDVLVIDAKGIQQADTIQNLRPRHAFLTDENVAAKLLYRNFVIGCTALVEAKAARSAVPFPASMVHDHWLALWCATRKGIAVNAWPLVKYRLHGCNQTTVLSGVNSKEDYYRQRIAVFTNRIEELQERIALPEMPIARQWALARELNYAREPHARRTLWRLRAVNSSTTIFELVMPFMPNWIFQTAVRRIKNGKL